MDTLRESTTEERRSWQIEYGIDPLTIILLISVTLTLIRVIQECRKKKFNLMSSSEQKSLFDIRS